MAKRDIEVLKHLRVNARKPFTQISRETGIPTTTIFDYYNNFMKNTITKQVSLLNFKNIGYHFNSFFFVKCENIRPLLNFLKKNKKINNLFAIDEHSILFEAVFHNANEKHSFTDVIENFNLKELKEHGIMDEIKREEFIPS